MTSKPFAYLLLCLSLTSGTLHAGDSKPPAAGDALPELTLPTPKDSGQQVYLGLTTAETFQISQINAEVLLIEIFNMY
jgi:hypothetical protein